MKNLEGASYIACAGCRDVTVGVTGENPWHNRSKNQVRTAQSCLRGLQGVPHKRIWKITLRSCLKAAFLAPDAPGHRTVSVSDPRPEAAVAGRYCLKLPKATVCVCSYNQEGLFLSCWKANSRRCQGNYPSCLNFIHSLTRYTPGTCHCG